MVKTRGTFSLSMNNALLILSYAQFSSSQIFDGAGGRKKSFCILMRMGIINLISEICIGFPISNELN